jgi:phage tail sheath protein FI
MPLPKRPNKRPGIFVEELTTLPPSIFTVETALPAFIGYTQKADNELQGDLHLKPFRIASMADYIRYFGAAQPETGIKVHVTETRGSDGKTLTLSAEAALEKKERSRHIMYYALQMFFANGGGLCYIVSVNPYKTPGSPLEESELKAGLDALAAVNDPTLILFPEAQRLDTIESFRSLHDLALQQCSDIKNRFVIMDIYQSASPSETETDIDDALMQFRNDGIGPDNLMYGAAYAPDLFTTLELSVDEHMTEVMHTLNETATVSVTLGSLKTSGSSIYEPARNAVYDLKCILPPSAAMAGIYATVDRERGVWKAPANITLNSVTGTTLRIASAQQEKFTIDPRSGKSINMIRTFPGTGTLVWGARTLAGNDQEWRYLNVRRFISSVEESIKRGLAPFVFEPNNERTWLRIHAMIQNYLYGFWQQGALQGAKPEEAFFIALGLGKTMTEQDILDGHLIVETGLATSRPAEFIIVRLVQKMAAI